MNRIRLFAIAFVLGLVVVGTLALASWWLGGVAPAFHGQTVDSTRPAADFTLTTAGGRRVSLSDYRGKVVLLFFGYRFCPDVCPTTLTELKQMMQTLGGQMDGVQVIMVSVDPERDTPDAIQEHVSRFHPRFLGLSGTPDEIAAASTPFGVFYTREPGSENTGYLVTHTASITAVDPAGYVRVVYPFGTTGVDIAADVRVLLRP